MQFSNLSHSTGWRERKVCLNLCSVCQAIFWVAALISWITADPHRKCLCILACEAALWATSSINLTHIRLPSVPNKMQREKDINAFLSHHLWSLIPRLAFFACVSFIPQWNNNQYSSNKVIQDFTVQSRRKYVIWSLFNRQHLSKDVSRRKPFIWKSENP